MIYAGIPIVLTFFLKIKKQTFGKRILAFLLTLALFLPLYALPYFVDGKKNTIAGKKLVEPFFAPTSIYRNTYGVLKKKIVKRSIPLAKRRKIEELFPFDLDEETKDFTFVLVIGESTRGDHLSINGYDRLTTPKLEKRTNLISYTNATSCSARTVFSVACLLSHLPMVEFSLPLKDTSAISVMKSLGFKTFFLSNHLHKGRSNCEEADVCFMHNEKNKVLEGGTANKFDLSLLELMAHTSGNFVGNKFIVLHTMGSHANYNNRVPDDRFRQFRPICDKASLYNCSTEELNNSYDNSILYVDEFLDQLFNKLDDEKAMVLFASDHGESLGEKGVYLHSKPNFLAPSAQRDIPLVFWGSKGVEFSEGLKQRMAQRVLSVPIDHDTIFHSILDCSGVSGDLVDQKQSVCN